MLKSLSTALDVLTKFTPRNPDWGLRELAKEMEMNHTVLYRILKTFEDKGFLIQDELTKKYELGSKIYDLLAVVQSKVNLSDLVVPLMKELSEVIEETVFLTWKDGYHGKTVEISESTQQIKFAVSIGYKTPLYVGASTKVMMAFLDEKEQLAIIKKGTEKFTDHTLVTEKEILSDLRKIKQAGWCYSEGEFAEDVFGIGVPIFGNGGKIVASLTVAGPVYRIYEEKKKECLKKIVG
ncbi:IclR family transcriptional regulator [Virgibacillus halophilus]|uniref:IclR family transcriptional regulator n=1 Tax=Tigheibacillus halophilus TaxID=361280 RepID=A0ABU5C2I5_9BACI|nr:IclR family transcriptional regulator [Virgibacillus halophilus]